jgi:hypothetical protein
MNDIKNNIINFNYEAMLDLKVLERGISISGFKKTVLLFEELMKFLLMTYERCTRTKFGGK